MNPWITFGVKLPAPLPRFSPSNCFGVVTFAPFLRLKIAYGALP